MAEAKMKGPPRRSRSVLEGRKWECRFCNRGYLSSNSLIFHARSKHHDEPTLEEFIKTQFKNAIEQ